MKIDINKLMVILRHCLKFGFDIAINFFYKQ